ncbi:hypothetical protein HZS_7652 [Henneguya salminicola]|nr:hypothetical protein HZS_7652 [Henneguya salminicola]
MDLQKNNLVGLSTEQAEHQRKIHGRNEFFNSSESSILWKYLSHFSEPMISLLLLSGLVSVILGEYEDALSIFMAIFIVVTLAFVQEYNSDKSIAAISKLLPPLCIYRDKRITQILAAELVPDDIVILHTGDRVPADIKIIHSTNLKVDESSLTGESRSVNKFATINGDQNPKEHNIIFMGTIISYGHAKGVVINTGVNTQFGTLHFLMNQEQDPKSPLKINMEYLGKQISILSTLTICRIFIPIF